MKQIIAENEKEQMLILTERRNSLIELKDILEECIDENEENMRGSIIKDLDENSTNIQLWWDEILEKYEIVTKENESVFLSFGDNSIYNVES